MNQRPLLPAAVLALLLALTGLLFVTGPYPWFPFGLGGKTGTPGGNAWWQRRAAPDNRPAHQDPSDPAGATETTAKAKQPVAEPKGARSATETLLDELRRQAGDATVHNNEVILIFADAGGYTGFLADVQGGGITVTGKIPELNTVRVRFVADAELNAALDRALMLRDVQLLDLDLNWKMQLEEVLGAASPSDQTYEHLVELLGLRGVRLNWGTGIRIAYLDTGLVLNTAQFFPRLSQIDIGLGLEPDDRHGLAIALLATGGWDLAQGLTGLAPAADVLSIRVTDSQGIPDVFAVAQGLVVAANAGARLIEVSPYSSHDALVLKLALDYAINRQGAAVIAARGLGETPGWPAVDPRVIAVGAIDAFGAPPLTLDQVTAPLASAPAIRAKAQVGPGLASDYVAVHAGPTSAAIVAAAIAAVITTFPDVSPAEAWFQLQRSAKGGEHTKLGPAGAGFRVLDLGWLAPELAIQFNVAVIPSTELPMATVETEVIEVTANGQVVPRPTQFLPGTPTGRTAIIRGTPPRTTTPPTRGPARGRSAAPGTPPTAAP